MSLLEQKAVKVLGLHSKSREVKRKRSSGERLAFRARKKIKPAVPPVVPPVVPLEAGPPAVPPVVALEVPPVVPLVVPLEALEPVVPAAPPREKQGWFTGTGETEEAQILMMKQWLLMGVDIVEDDPLGQWKHVREIDLNEIEPWSAEKIERRVAALEVQLGGGTCLTGAGTY